MMRFYCGIGSRSTPDDILQAMEDMAARLSQRGYILRSGHAPGADQAFERGAAGKAQLFLPWASFELKVRPSGSLYIKQDPEAFRIAAEIHPAWRSLSRGARLLHARNVHQVLGPDLRSPSEFLVCWTPEGKIQGGTATAIHLAIAHHIPVVNLATDAFKEVDELILR